MSAKGGELVWYVLENEELKLKVPSLMDEVKTKAKEIIDLRKIIVAQKEECHASSEQVMYFKNLVVERNKVKLLGFVVVVL